MTNEVPTPDEVEFGFRELCYAAGKWRGDAVIAETYASPIRAHIAALEEQIDCMTKHQAGADEKLCQLEAENKRLAAELDFTERRMKHEADERDKADDQNKRLVDAIKGVIRVADRKTVEFDEAKAAIAQTGEKW